MWFLDNIVSWLDSVSGYFKDAYQKVRGWVWPFYYLSTPLYYLYYAFWYLTYYFGHFNTWLDWAAGRIESILTSGGILGLINWWFPQLGSMIDWFLSRWSWFTTLIINWWGTTSTIVKGWINIAIQGFNALLVTWDEFWKITFPFWTTELLRIGSDLSNFFTATLPNFVSFKWLGIWWNSRLKELDILINDTIKDWLETKLIDWFLGKEE